MGNDKIPYANPDSDHAIMEEIRVISWRGVAWGLVGLVSAVVAWGSFVTASVWNMSGNCESTRSRLAHVEDEGDANSAALARLQLDFAGHPSSREIRDLLGRAASLERYQQDDDGQVQDIKTRLAELEAVIRQLHPLQSGGMPIDPAVLDWQRRNRTQPQPEVTQ